MGGLHGRWRVFFRGQGGAGTLRRSGAGTANPPTSQDRQENPHAVVKEMEVLLLPATEGFVKLSDLNLMDKQL